jgi:hypothetical protein
MLRTRASGVVFAILVSAALVGCGDGRTKMNLAKTSGKVTCEGKPIPFATVYFEPLQEGKNAIVGKQAIGRADEDGVYILTTYDTEDGAVVGKHRVRVGKPLGEAGGKFQCDCALNEEIDVMSVEVVAGQDNEFDIDLKRATQAQKNLADQRGAQDAEIDD